MIELSHLERASKILETSGSTKANCGSLPQQGLLKKASNETGIYSRLMEAGARMEIPGCSLCMGNQQEFQIIRGVLNLNP